MWTTILPRLRVGLMFLTRLARSLPQGCFPQRLDFYRFSVEHADNAHARPRRDHVVRRHGLELQALALEDHRDFARAVEVGDEEQAYAWAYLNPEIAEYMVAEFLPGRNFACNVLFHDDQLVKVGCYERLEYFGGHLVVSGVSGNISRGKLVS